MRDRNRSLSRCAACLALFIAGSSCTSTRRGVQRLASSHLADTATSYNLAIEQTQDEMLLLNVIRAQDNYPLYLTDASKVTGTVKAEVNLGLKFPLVHFGSANANDYFATPTVDYSSSPSMDVNLLNAKDFMTGFLTPISSDLFAYYWDQGWPSEFLLYLLVLRVDEYEETQDAKDPLRFVASYQNHPDSHDSSQRDLARFAHWVHTLVKDGRPLLCSEDAEGSTVGPALTPQELGELKFLVPVAKEGLALSPAGDDVPANGSTAGKWQLKQPKKAYSLSPYNDAHSCPKKLKQAAISGTIAPPSQKEPGEAGKTAANTSLITARGAAGGGQVFVLTLRSPEGLLYYLGQLARLENRADKKSALLIHVCDFKSGCAAGSEPPVAPLFVALDKEEHGGCPSIIWVRALDGSDYMIPKGRGNPYKGTGQDLQFADAAQLCVTGRSMHALDLLSQLIGLQKTGKDLTTTSTVKVVGQ